MIITDEYTSEYVYNSIKLDEKAGIIENTPLEHDQKYGKRYCRSVKVKCVVKFLDRINTKRKILRSTAITLLEE